MQQPDFKKILKDSVNAKDCLAGASLFSSTEEFLEEIQKMLLVFNLEEELKQENILSYKIRTKIQCLELLNNIFDDIFFDETMIDFDLVTQPKDLLSDQDNSYIECYKIKCGFNQFYNCLQDYFDLLGQYIAQERKKTLRCIRNAKILESAVLEISTTYDDVESSFNHDKRTASVCFNIRKTKICISVDFILSTNVKKKIGKVKRDFAILHALVTQKDFSGLRLD